MRFSFREYIFLKESILRKLESKLSRESKNKARSDWHAKRKPRPCGMTIHPALGCSNRCLYCYIQDMGFDFTESRPYALSGDELVYALLSNKYFVPGPYGTYLAFGSITEPFLSKEITSKTIDYLLSAARLLGNPMQISTKSNVSSEVVSNIKRAIKGASLSVLVTILTLNEEKSKIIEPRVPPPEKRLETIKFFAKEGFTVFVFYRPIIPSFLSTDDFEDVVSEAKRYGAAGVVIGGLRITPNIVSRLSKAGINVSEILRRAKEKPTATKQVSVNVSDYKKEFLVIAKEKGLYSLKSACCANTISYFLQKHEIIPCAGLCYATGMCADCGIQCYKMVPEVLEEDIVYALNSLIKLNYKPEILVKKYSIGIYLDKRSLRRAKKEDITKVMNVIYRRKVVLKLKSALNTNFS